MFLKFEHYDFAKIQKNKMNSLLSKGVFRGGFELEIIKEL
jgi:hypothetical protein